MKYQTLSNKWRPKTFSDVVGQEHVIEILSNSLFLKRIHHSWLFSGTHGIGKTSIARILAKCLECEKGITSVPCEKCNNCNEIKFGRFVDLIEIDGASKTKIEDIRDILENIQYAPIRGRFKIYLIDEVHMLSRYSFNALLKILEEPPEHIKFLFATTELKKIPVTVLSRCLQLHLKKLSIENIKIHIKFILDKEEINYDINALQLLSQASEGSLRDALILTEQAIFITNGKKITEFSVRKMLGILSEDHAISLIEAIVQKNGNHVMMLVNEIASYGIEWEELLIGIQRLLHCIAIEQFSSSILNEINIASKKKNRIKKLSSIIKSNDLHSYYQILSTGRKELSFSPNRRMGVEMVLLRMLSIHLRNDL